MLNFKFDLKIQFGNCKGFCRGKSPDQTMGLGPHIEFDHARGEGVGAKRAPAQFLWAQTCLKGSPRRNVSSDVPNMAQTCTLPAIKNHSN